MIGISRVYPLCHCMNARMGNQKGARGVAFAVLGKQNKIGVYTEEQPSAGRSIPSRNALPVTGIRLIGGGGAAPLTGTCLSNLDGLRWGDLFDEFARPMPQGACSYKHMTRRAGILT